MSSTVGKIRVEVVYAAKDSLFSEQLEVSANANIAMALRQSGLLQQFPKLELENLVVGVFSKKCSIDAPLRDGDRIEVYRPLEVDPMTARRNRAKR